MPQEVHLLVMIHGMWGIPDNLSEAKRIIQEKPNISGEGGVPRLEVLVAQSIQQDATYDGIDWGGERIAKEVYDKIAEIEEDKTRKVTLFSVFGYSLGGLLARYLLGILHSRNFFDHVKPLNYTTFATPHIGIPRYKSLIGTVSALLGSRLLARSGEQLYVVDKWGKEGRPLLEVMADKKRIFWRALALFPNLHIYANSVSDFTVPFVTAAIELEDEFLAVYTNEMEIQLNPRYGPLIQSYNRIEPPVSSRFTLRSLAPSRPLLPPFLKRGFLFETTLLILSPVLLPTVLSLVVLRFARDSRASRLRIKLLEADDNNETKLVNMLDSLEGAVEQLIDPIANADLIEVPLDTSLGTLQSSLSPTVLDTKTYDKQDAQPILSDAQKTMVGTLNDIPQLEKHFAFFHPVRNAHGLIVCRDAEAARRVGGEWETMTKQAEGVLQHWADGFVVG